MEEEITEITRQHNSSPLPGAVIGHYFIDEPIGNGICAKTYRGHNQYNQRPCAIKLFRQCLEIGPVKFGRFQHELNQIHLIGNSYLEQTFYSGAWADEWYSVTEFLGTMTLHKWIERSGSLSIEAGRSLLSKICKALIPLHQNGLSHRFIHSGQIFLIKDPISKDGFSIKVSGLASHHLLPKNAEDLAAIIPSPLHASC